MTVLRRLKAAPWPVGSDIVTVALVLMRLHFRVEGGKEMERNKLTHKKIEQKVNISEDISAR